MRYVPMDAACVAAAMLICLKSFNQRKALGSPALHSIRPVLMARMLHPVLMLMLMSLVYVSINLNKR